ncbi:MAG: UDP-N-acetylglucosamine 2-epimerase (hydrolyzing) [Candidatus Atribacteria bacterium]|nr:UDP-N-acetylglucosamine 2-epimerase (hydrolyzing) [Candidatus Atribacteria bacterium]
MKIGILTSSRADFGIYYPLVKELWKDDFFEIEIIAFGTHLKKEYGYTIEEIKKLGFEVKHKIETLTKNDGAIDISNNIGDAIIKFSHFWDKNKFDLVFALGDRYEMFAAVTAASTFNINIAHLHAGETTLGAIDNIYRHSISLMSKYLFVSTDEYKERATEISQQAEHVFNVGALSIDNLVHQDFYSKEEFYEAFKIDLKTPSILTTFHPETVSIERNEEYIDELIAALAELKHKYQIIITMPNSDTKGDMIRQRLIEFGKGSHSVKLVESLGMKGYLSAMKFCSMLLGNTSSGFVEASFFPKWVINLGDRQKGRILAKNILNTKISKEEILTTVNSIENSELPLNTHIYGEGNASKKIISRIKMLYGIK